MVHLCHHHTLLEGQEKEGGIGEGGRKKVHVIKREEANTNIILNSYKASAMHFRLVWLLYISFYRNACTKLMLSYTINYTTSSDTITLYLMDNTMSGIQYSNTRCVLHFQFLSYRQHRLAWQPVHRCCVQYICSTCGYTCTQADIYLHII